MSAVATPPPNRLLEIENLRTHFFLEEGVLRAVDGVSLTIDRHQTLGIIGESGCGKSVMAQSVLQIVPPPGKLIDGRILLHAGGGAAVDVAALDPFGEEIRRIRGGVVSMVFQEPMTSLSPVHNIGDQVAEMILQHTTTDKRQAAEATVELLNMVGIPDPASRMASYPHELSGGLRQRVVIAMALACNPDLLIADEPTTALDVTVQAQILELMKSLQQRFGTGIMFITHDLGIIAGMADEVAVMYLGRIVERAPVKQLFSNPQHPYTVGLLNSVPRLGSGRRGRLASIEGTVPLPIDMPPQCGFFSRCEKAIAGSATAACRRSSRSGRTTSCAASSTRGASRKRGSMASESHPILDVRKLSKHFPIETGFLRRAAGSVRAVDGVSFAVARGTTLGLVGESGCGKTTLGRCLLRVVEPTSGTIRFQPETDVVELLDLDKRELRSMRRFMQMVFQDPYASLDPRMTVLDIVGEPLRENGLASGDALASRVAELVETVGLETKHLKRYPHAFSGGQRQRIGIARALAPNPKLIVCDEAVSALDVSIQAQILNLLQDLQEAHGLTYLFIAHDLAVVEHIADRVAVMYAGEIVEMANADDLFERPSHPYTEALLSAVPQPDPEARVERITLSGEVSDPADHPSGCRFHPRCPYAQDLCKSAAPASQEVSPGHSVSCHFAADLTLKGVR